MKYTLAESLKVILPELPDILVSSEFRSRILKLAGSLPPLPWGGFECHLNEDNGQTDFHQGFEGDMNIYTIVRDHLTDQKFLSQPTWNRIHDFLSAWTEHSSLLNQNIPLVVFEFDIKKSLSGPLLPSIFVTIKKPEPIKIFGREFRKITGTVLKLLLDRMISNKLQSTLDRCIKACPGKCFINHVGLMLSRNSKIIRVNFVGTEYHQIKLFLERLVWKGSMKKLESAYKQYQRFAKHIILCVDIGDQIQTRIGLEIFPGSGSDINNDWTNILDHLVKYGLCTTEKRNVLLSWPGKITPKPDESAFWPGHLIVESMIHPEDKFSMFKKNLSHIKLTISPENKLSAKAYLEFYHTFAELKKRSEFTA